MLAHSLLSRNKSDCQTDYKLRNFGNRNYLHAITKIQLFIVGVKISKMKNTKFGKFQEKKFNSLTAVKGGAVAGGKTSTTKMRTDETRNDIDSNSGIEGAAFSNEIG